MVSVLLRAPSRFGHNSHRCKKGKIINFCQFTKKSLFWPFLKNNGQNGTYFCSSCLFTKTYHSSCSFLRFTFSTKPWAWRYLHYAVTCWKKGLFTLGQLFVYNIVLHVKPLKIAKYVHSKIMCNAHTYLQRDSFSRLKKKTTTIFTKYEKNVLKCAICRLLDIIFFCAMME